MTLRPALALALLSAALTAPAQTRQPSDLQLLARVQSVLRHEPAFAGMSITPSVSHAIVSLNGQVDSEAARVLASNEAGSVAGVKTVLNNLTLATAAVAAPAPPPPAPAPFVRPVESRTVTLLPQTVLSVRVDETIDTKIAKPNDTFRGTLASSVVQDGTTIIPVGTSVTGRVVDAKSATHFTGGAQLSLELVSINLPASSGEPRLSVVTDPWSSQVQGRGKNTAEKTGGGAAIGAIIGALAGGGSGAAIGAASGGALGAGANGVTKGKEITVKAEQLLQFKTSAPVDITVRTRDGRPIQSAPDPGPTLQTRPNTQSDARLQPDPQ